jgi:hypothetical protein
MVQGKKRYVKISSRPIDLSKIGLCVTGRFERLQLEETVAGSVGKSIGTLVLAFPANNPDMLYSLEFFPVFPVLSRAKGCECVSQERRLVCRFDAGIDMDVRKYSPDGGKESDVNVSLGPEK